MSDQVISARGLHKHYGANHVLRGLNCTVGKGVTGLLGANGAGKTTFMGMVLGLHPPTGGTLEVLGKDPQHNGPEIRARLGYAPEHHILPEDVQAADLVHHIAQLHGLPRRAATERASDVLWQVGLGEERFRPIGTMSTGQRQRVKLAQAIAHDPALLLLDEPTDGLDPVQRDDMLALIHRIGDEFGIDILLSSHLLEEVSQVCDSVLIITEGVFGLAGRIKDLEVSTGGLIVEVDGDPAPLVAQLQAAGVEVQVNANQLTCTAEGELHDLIRDLIADSGLGLRRLAPRRTTIEDVYVSANQ